VCEKAGTDVSTVFDALEKGWRNGMLFRTARKDGEFEYAYMDIYVDGICTDERNNIHGPKYQELWQQWSCELKTRQTKEIAQSDGLSSPIRVLPVPEHGHDHNTIIPLEDAREIIRKSSVRAVQQCACRYRTGRCDYPKDVCISLDFMAQEAIDRGSGTSITKDEALAILRRSSDAGLVHITTEYHFENSDCGVEFICNCCPCCCAFLEPYVTSGGKVQLGGNYYAEINNETCVDCGACQKRCHVNAIYKEGEALKIDQSKCFGCGVCAHICPKESIKMRQKEDVDFSFPVTEKPHFLGPRE